MHSALHYPSWTSLVTVLVLIIYCNACMMFFTDLLLLACAVSQIINDAFLYEILCIEKHVFLEETEVCLNIRMSD